MSTGGGGGRRSNRAVPAFHGNNFIHSNPLPPVSNLPSFSYGSPQTALPKQISVRDTKVAMTDALETANAAAKARLEAAARERKLAEERLAAEAAKALDTVPENNPPQKATRTPNMNRKRSLRSQSVLSRDASDREDESRDSESYQEGDETSLEIYRIIAGATNPHPDPSMLRSRSVNAGTKEPRSAMKGSREEALRPSAKTRAKAISTRRTVPQLPVPINGERDATFDEENQAIGIVRRVPSSVAASSPTPQPPSPRVVDEEPFEYGGHEGTPPDTIGHSDVPETPMTGAPSAPSVGRTTKEAASVSFSQKLSPKQFLPVVLAKNGFKSAANGLKKTAVILGIFVNNLFGSLLNYLFLGFFIFGITTLSYSFIQRSTSFTAPVLPPSSSSEISRRLMDVERQLGSLTRSYDKGAKRWDSFSDAERDQVASIKSILSAYSSLSSALETHTRGYQTDRRASISTMSTINAHIENFDKTIKKNNLQHKQDAQQVRDQLTKVQGHMKDVDAEIKRLKQSQELGEKALRSIEAMLPKQIAARLDPETGKIIVSPELLRHLQTAFRKDIQDEIAKLGPSTGGAKTGGSTVIANWDEFLKTNAAKLRGYLGQMSEEKWKEAIADGVVVSKEDMMRMIREQLESVRNIAERDNTALMKKLLQEAEGVAKTVASSAATSISSAALAAASNYVRNAKGGGSSNQYADALIQAALHQYSATVLLKPDYALRARGTLIDPRFTSSTFDPYGKPGLLGTFSSFLRTGPNEPAHVLTESTNVGDCWSFPQSSGQVSILFAEGIFPTDVTIDHVPRGISGDDSSAPREVEFWVHIEDDIVRGHVSKAAAVAIGDVSDNPSTRQYLVNGYVRVASFIYDVNSQYPVQTFELPVDLQKLGVSVSGASFRVLSNWGNEEYTSIYRLRVHGNPVRTQNNKHATRSKENIPGL